MATFLSTSRGAVDDALDFGSGLLHKLGVIDDVPKVVVQMPTKQMRLFNGGGLTVKQKYPTDIPIDSIRNNTGQRVLPLNLGTAGRGTVPNASLVPSPATEYRRAVAIQQNNLRMAEASRAAQQRLANLPIFNYNYSKPVTVIDRTNISSNTPKFFSSVVDDVGNVVRSAANTSGKYIPNSLGNAGKVAGNVLGGAGKVIKFGLGPIGQVLGETFLPSDLEIAIMNGTATPQQLASVEPPKSFTDFVDKSGSFIYSRPMPQQVVQTAPQQVQVPADEYTVGSSLYRRPMPQQLVQTVPQQLVQTVPQQLVQTVPQQVVRPVPQQVVRPVPQQVVRPVPQRVYQTPMQVAQPDTSFLNLGDMGNADIHPDYRGMSASDASALANQRADAQVAAYNPPVQMQQVQQPQQPQVDYNAILQAQAQQMQQQQEQSRFFEERPENLFWDSLTERYVTSQEYYR
jgi:hypothetical protein